MARSGAQPAETRRRQMQDAGSGRDVLATSHAIVTFTLSISTFNAMTIIGALGQGPGLACEESIDRGQLSGALGAVELAQKRLQRASFLSDSAGKSPVISRNLQTPVAR